jgi:hypothetical protein
MTYTDDALNDAIGIAAGGKPNEKPRSGNGTQQNSSTTAQPFPFVLAHDITLEPKEFLIEGFLGRYEVSAWYGPPDSAKSVVMVHAQACVAAGIEYCGRRVMQALGCMLPPSAVRSSSAVSWLGAASTPRPKSRWQWSTTRLTCAPARSTPTA